MKTTNESETDLIPMLCEDGYTNFLIKIITKGDDLQYFMEFEVYEVDSLDLDDNKAPSEIELYLEGFIKWDGCSHVYFGAKDENGERDGYLHLCGKTHWRRHAEVMMKIYELAEKTILGYDEEIGV
jgi:hypothetical protein